jgi:hypothetical protein
MKKKLDPINIYGLLEKNVGNFRKHTLNFAASLSLYCPVILFVNKKDHDHDIDYYIGKFHNLRVSNVYNFKSKTNIYLLANNPPHRFLFEAFIKNPGVVVFHDISLYWLMKQVLSTKFVIETELSGQNSNLIEMALESNNPRISSMAIHGIYFNNFVIEKAHGSFVHSKHAAYSLKLKNKNRKKIFEINIPDNNDIYNSIISKKDNFRTQKNAFINISIFGYMSSYKNIYEFLQSLKKLNSNLGKNLNINIIGNWDPTYKSLCQALLKDLSEIMRITLIDKYVSDSELESFYNYSDIIINLRYPTCGETSGILSETINLNKIIVVTKIGSFIHSENLIKVDIGKSIDEYVKNIAESIRYAIKLYKNKKNYSSEPLLNKSLKIYGAEIYYGLKSVYE